MKILVLAQNPKTEANLTTPIKGTKSWAILERWVKEAGIPESALQLDNAFLQVGDFTYKTAYDDTRRWFGLVVEYPVIVTLGAYAENAIKETRHLYFPHVKEWDHFHLPHPSGLNRVLNNPEAHRDAVEQLKAAYAKLLTLSAYGDRIRA